MPVRLTIVSHLHRRLSPSLRPTGWTLCCTPRDRRAGGSLGGKNLRGCRISGIIGYIEITEASELQMQILIPASLPQSSFKERPLPFQIMIEEDHHVPVLTATRDV